MMRRVMVSGGAACVMVSEVVILSEGTSLRDVPKSKGRRQ